ncbi:hypothetical protein [Actibacterium sp. 188UL27-1]
MSDLPFVRTAMGDERLSLHALFFDIGEGRLAEWSDADQAFTAV